MCHIYIQRLLMGTCLDTNGRLKRGTNRDASSTNIGCHETEVEPTIGLALLLLRSDYWFVLPNKSHTQHGICILN